MKFKRIEFSQLDLDELIQTDEGLYKHSIDVKESALILGKAIGFSQEQLEGLAIGAFYHDIGKVLIPRKILDKKGPLSMEDRKTIEKHPILGYYIIQKSVYKDNKIVNECVRYHHEKLNGSGYPDNIKNIPDYVQVVTICDIYNALISKRAYKEAFPYDETISLIYKDVENRKLNKELVNIFIDNIKKPEIILEEKISQNKSLIV